MARLSVALLLVFVALCAGTKWFELDSYSFEDYEAEHHKFYENEEERSWRKNLFEQNLKEIMEHNRGDFSWKKGVNQFTDRTTEEFRIVLGYDKQLSFQLHEERNARAAAHPQVFNGDPRVAVDWREEGIVTPVKDQGACGSCWTFATAEVIESAWAKKTGLLSVLSEQQIASCTPNPNNCGGTGGCAGGISEIAFSQIMNLGGLASEWTYPYLSYHGKDYPCLYGNTSTPGVAQITGYTSLPANELQPLMNAVSNHGPIAISVDASAWNSYESGVFNGCNATNIDIDHAVVLVGYGTDASLDMDYWIVRNSWSPAWGEEGYIRLARQSEPTCGTDYNPSYGTGCDGGPPTVTCCGTCGILYDSSYPHV